mgnify:CR=1 FL=1
MERRWGLRRAWSCRTESGHGGSWPRFWAGVRRALAGGEVPSAGALKMWQEARLRPRFAEHGIGGHAQPPLGDGGIHGAEVGRVAEVTVVDEGIEAGLFAEKAALDLSTKGEEDAGGTVIRTAACVLGDATAELAPGEHDDVVLQSMGFEVAVEGCEPFVEGAEEFFVLVELGRMGVESRRW